MHCVSAAWNRILLAYQESTKQFPNVPLPPHPEPNPYPRAWKKKDWPVYLDNARGVYAKSVNLDGIAHHREPLEKVTPLHAAAMGNNARAIFRLLADGSPVDPKDIRGQTPAYWAAYHGNLHALMILANFGADLRCQDLRGKTLLRAAAKYGHDDVVSFLVSHRVNLHARDGRGLTPLHVAAFHQRFSVYEKLLFYGADPAIKDNFGRTAEEILRMKCAEIYHKRCFFSRLFSSPEPPPMRLWQAERLAARIA